MRVVLIEDEVPALEHLEAMLTELRPDWEVVARLRTVRQVREWLEHGSCDLIVADIQLGDGRSLDALGDQGTPVVFTTAYDAFMAEAFDKHGVAYLLKPVELDSLRAALERRDRLERHFVGNLRGLLRDLQRPSTRLVGRRGVDWVGVEVDELRWIRVRHGVTTATMLDGTQIMLEEPLLQLETRLAPTFFRANRWYLVSLAAVARVRPIGRGRLALTLSPESDEGVEVTQQHAAAFRRWFGMP